MHRSPLGCCSLDWMFRDGLANGGDYTKMIDVECTFVQFPDRADTRPLWERECEDFIEHCESLADGFMEQCVQNRG